MVKGACSMTGNNCVISSVAQCLFGTSDFASKEQLQLCSEVRAAGVGTYWQKGDFIEASSETLGFVAAQVLGCAHLHVELQLHSGHDGDNIEVIHSGTIDSQRSAPHTIHVYNPVGVHYDPLWFAALPGDGAPQGY